MTPPRIAIIGAGAAGLTAAFELQRRGAAVVVYEADGWVGGRARTDSIDGFAIDAGAQLFGSVYTDLLALVRELGVDESLLRAPGRDALWRDGRAHEVVYGSIASMLSSRAVGVRTKMRLGTTYLPFLNRHSASLDLHAPERAAAAGLDSESIAAWGTREIGKEFVDYLVYPQLAAFYGSLPEKTSAGLYHILARYGADATLHAFRGGVSVFTTALADAVRRKGGEVRLSTPAESIQASPGSVVVGAAGTRETFDGTVVATAAPAARRLLSDEGPDLLRWLDGVRFRPGITVGLLLDCPVGVRFFGLALPRGESRVLAAVCVQEEKAPGLVPEGKGALVALLRPDAAAEYVEAEARVIVDAVVADLVRFFPGIDSRISRARLYRWRDGNPLFYPGYLSHLAEFRRGTPEERRPITLAGDYLVTPSVEGAIRSGVEAAERLLGRLAAG